MQMDRTIAILLLLGLLAWAGAFYGGYHYFMYNHEEIATVVNEELTEFVAETVYPWGSETITLYVDHDDTLRYKADMPMERAAHEFLDHLIRHWEQHKIENRNVVSF